MILREYQKEAHDIGVDLFNNQKEFENLFICPTAWGKSILCATIPKEIEDNTIVLTTSKELLRQNYNKMLGFGGEASIFSASFNKRKLGKTTYATLQTAFKYATEFKKAGYKNLFCDEIHLFSRSPSGMYRKFLKESGIKKIIGLTATPFKLDLVSNYAAKDNYTKIQAITTRGKNRALMQNISYLMQIHEIIKKGYWSKLEYEVIEGNTGVLIFNTTGADFTEESIKNYYSSNNLHTKITKRCIDSDRKSILIFVPSILNALELSSILPGSVAVWSGMPSKDRDEAIMGFKNGKYRYVINVRILAVGFDHEKIDHIIDGCPNGSLADYYQKIGRGTRIHSDKKNCLITDFSGNFNRFGPIEDLIYYQRKNGMLDVFSRHRRLSEVRISEIAPYIGKKDVYFNYYFLKYNELKVNSIPYNNLINLLQTYNWNSDTNHIREEILKIKRSW